LSFVKLSNASELHYLALGQPSPKTAIFLHGIMGNKKNWQGFVKTFIESFGSWNAIVFDLRNHGESSKHQAPFSVEAAARDVAEALNILTIKPRAIIGHSFGGKVATLAAEFMVSIEQLWLLDSSFSALNAANPLEESMSTTAFEVLEILDQVIWPVESRRALINELLARGMSNQIALWMTTNLVEEGEAFRLSFEPSELKKMLMDFMALDLWERVSFLDKNIHLVAAEYGFRLNAIDRQHLQQIAGPRGFFHVLKDSGHFVQADNPHGLIELMKPYFS
jgi:pimeloyl-ACP methyl ester carboxylesterase